ncbi:uncharacterized protein LOC141656420 [Silene latifolia]|uniref:uncharacterized protein LOC141656420 n=1 Tax=Silene latifolia TaxID=37657 RepID=UPI003D77EB3B
MDTPSSVKDFRPIAYCTTFYKVGSKILPNRLQGALDYIIGPEQAAFIAHRALFDNAMMAHKLASKYGRAYLTPRCLLKVDKEGWVMACVSSPYYSLSINGGEIAQSLQEVTSLSVKVVAQCLKIFDSLSGYQANPTKTSLYFGGVNSYLRATILEATGFCEGEFYFRYLGLPLFNARIANDMYQTLMDNIKEKVAHLSNIFLSYMKDILVSKAGYPGLAVAWLHACSVHNSFNVAQMYQLIRQSADLVLWSSLVHDNARLPKHSFLGILALENKLPTIDNLIHRGLFLVRGCVLCCTHSENLKHLFFQCPFSSLV